MTGEAAEVKDGDADLMAATACITALVEHGIPIDIQELLVRGNPQMGIKPRSRHDRL